MPLNSAPVLFVEDHDDIRQDVVEILLARGIDTTAVGCTEEANALIDADGASFSVGLFDLKLPRRSKDAIGCIQNGKDLCARMRERHPATPIVIMTAEGNDVYVAMDILNDHLADQYLLKDFPAVEGKLIATIEDCRQRGREPTPTQRPSRFTGGTIIATTKDLRLQGVVLAKQQTHKFMVLRTLNSHRDADGQSQCITAPDIAEFICDEFGIEISVGAVHGAVRDLRRKCASLFPAPKGAQDKESVIVSHGHDGYCLHPDIGWNDTH